MTKIEPKEVFDRIASGKATLVCAYDDDKKFQDNHLDHAISLREFKARADSIPKDSEIIFYCA